MGNNEEERSQIEETEEKTEDVEKQGFFEEQRVDVKGLQNSFDSYATKKTFATGFFNLALIATNFTQMKKIVESPKAWGTVNIISFTVICISLLLQFTVGVILVYLGKSAEFIDEEKREQLITHNNTVTILVATISVLNVFLSIFVAI